MPLQFVKSRKGKDHLVHLGFRYKLERKGTTENFWICAEARNGKCRGRAYTANNEVLRVSSDHNHTPDAAKIEVKAVRAKIKAAAENNSDPPQVIVAMCIENISASASAQLPALRTLKRTIRKDRVKCNNSNPIPTSLLTLHIPNKYQMTSKDENFLLFDSGPSSDRILIFGTTKNLQHMESSSVWFADGTFKVAPQLFDQLYTIHASRFNKIIPTIFALLPNRKEITYVKMLTALKELAPGLNPLSITTDFERAAKNAFKSVFPSASQHGCLFHLGQCFWRRIQTLPEVSSNYVDDPDFALKVKCLTALAFVPPHGVKDAFKVLLSDPFYSQSSDIENLVDYVEDNWVGGNRRGRERPPKFAVDDWNCYGRVTDDLARTNNVVEGWHRGFQSQLGATHPTIWKFIETIKKQQCLNELQMEQQLAGESSQPQRKRYRDASDRLRIIVEDYGNRPIVDYLTGIAHNLNLNV